MNLSVKHELRHRRNIIVSLIFWFLSTTLSAELTIPLTFFAFDQNLQTDRHFDLVILFSKLPLFKSKLQKGKPKFQHFKPLVKTKSCDRKTWHRYLRPQRQTRRLVASIHHLAVLLTVPIGSPSRGGVVVACVKDITSRACPLICILFLCLFQSLGLFRLYFIP